MCRCGWCRHPFGGPPPAVLLVGTFRAPCGASRFPGVGIWAPRSDGGGVDAGAGLVAGLVGCFLRGSGCGTEERVVAMNQQDQGGGAVAHNNKVFSA